MPRKKRVGFLSEGAPAAPATPNESTADGAGRANPPETGARRLRARNLFEAVAKPFDGWAEPGRSSVTGRWRSRVGTGVALAAVIAQALIATAQETNGPAQTNRAAATTELAPTNGVAPTLSPTPTNSPAQTNDLPSTSSPAPADSAAPAQGPTRLDYSAFRMIADRNIFDPNRTPRRRGGGPPRAPKVTESFSLVGTMSYEKGTFAFFDGTSLEYRKVLKSDGAIAGYKITNIAPNYVKLASGTNQLELRVGMQMRRGDEGEWSLTGRTESYASAAAAPSAERPAASSDDENEIIKRLKQKREEASK